MTKKVKWKNLHLHLPRSNDEFTFSEVLGEIDQYHIEMVLSSLSKEDTVIDLGAHIGLFSLAVSEKVGRVISLEPNQKNAKIFRENMEANKIENIFLIEKAVSKKGGLRPFFINTEFPARHSLYLDPFFNWNGKLSKEGEIDTVSLEEIMQEYGIERVRVLKMDIEGAEYEVLLNAPKHVLKRIDLILLETHEPFENYSAEEITNHLKECGFECLEGEAHRFEFGDASLIGRNFLAVNRLILPQDL